MQLNETTYSPSNPFIGVGAGINKGLDLGVARLHLEHADGSVGGSFTPEARGDNGGKCDDYTAGFGLNSWGMPNDGPDGVPDPANTFAWDDIRRRIGLSIAGFSPQEFERLFYQLAGRFGITEFNFGCPNIRIGDSQKRIVSFDPEGMAEILALIGEYGAAEPNWIKLSPYSDPGMLTEVAAVIKEAKRADSSHVVQAVVNGNSFANGRGYIDGESMVDTEAAGLYGGVTGEALKPMSLGNAAKFREELPEEIAVIRCGGVSTGMDIWESGQVGCDGVQVVTHVLRRGPGVISEMRKQHEALIAA